MSAITRLGIVQTICDEIGLPVPTTTTSSSNRQVTQMVAFANQTGDDLRDSADWPVLRKTATISVISGTTDYTVELVSGSNTFACSRIVNETGWDSTNSWYFAGSVNDVEWNALQYSIGSTGLKRCWRTTADGTIEIYPTPDSSGDSLKVSFITSSWARSVAGGALTELAADDDYHLFNDRLFILGTKWRFLHSKGLPFDAEIAEYKATIDRRKAASRPARTVRLGARRGRPVLLGTNNIPDTGYGS